MGIYILILVSALLVDNPYDTLDRWVAGGTDVTVME